MNVKKNIPDSSSVYDIPKKSSKSFDRSIPLPKISHHHKHIRLFLPCFFWSFNAFPSFLTKTLQVIFLTLFRRCCQGHLRAATAGDGSRRLDAVGGHLGRIAKNGFQTTTCAELPGVAGAWHPRAGMPKESSRVG